MSKTCLEQGSAGKERIGVEKKRGREDSSLRFWGNREARVVGDNNQVIRGQSR